MQTCKIMTFNMRTQTTNDGDNQFFLRAPYIKERLDAIKPDVIGMQEVQPVMYERLIADLPDYYIVGGGRGRDRGDEAVCVAFLKERFTLCDLETFWLSATPDQPGSRYSGDQSPCPRVCTVVTLKPLNGSPFRVFNVHTDHVGKVARVLASNQVLQKLSELNERSPMPAFITGDFNADPDDLCITTITNYSAVKLIDLTAGSGITFHEFGKRLVSGGIKIDYIFAGADTVCRSMTVCRDERDGVFISDHFPLIAEVEL